jgi:hypothetical protein
LLAASQGYFIVKGWGSGKASITAKGVPRITAHSVIFPITGRLGTIKVEAGVEVTVNGFPHKYKHAYTIFNGAEYGPCNLEICAF